MQHGGRQPHDSGNTSVGPRLQGGGLPGPHSTRLLVCQAPPTPSCGHAQHVREPPPLSRCPRQGDVATSRGPPGATEAGKCSLRASRTSQACWLFDFRLLAPDRETIVSC